MKFGKVGQVVLVSTIALVVASLFTACGTLNVGFMFVATKAQTPGQIEVYEVDSESGSVRTIPTSPFPSGGRNPISEAVSPDSLNFYVANQDDANVVQFGIGTDGKLYPSSTVNTPGVFSYGHCHQFDQHLPLRCRYAGPDCRLQLDQHLPGKCIRLPGK